MARSGSSQHAAAIFATLEPRIRHVSANKIKKKWKQLPPAAQSNVRELLISLEQHAKQNINTRKSAKHAEAERSVERLSQKLIERLPRMPFPPSAVDESFDFELNLHRIRSIEDQLASNTHAMNLLNTQIEYEARQLEEDKQEVAMLEESLRSNDAHRQHQLRNIHPSARTTVASKDTSEATDLGHPTTESTSLDWHALRSDQLIGSHLLALRSHLHSMHNNKEAMKTVLEAMSSVHSRLLHVELHHTTPEL